MHFPEFLVNHPDGEIRIADSRIGLFDIVRRYQEGASPEGLVCEFPTLSLPLIHKVIAFYLENEAAVDAYVAGYRTELERQEATFLPNEAMMQLRRRLESMQRAEAS
jgi:uncharacterized protein (DUF433 family)